MVVLCGLCLDRGGGESIQQDPLQPHERSNCTNLRTVFLPRNGGPCFFKKNLSFFIGFFVLRPRHPSPPPNVNVDGDVAMCGVQAVPGPLSSVTQVELPLTRPPLPPSPLSTAELPPRALLSQPSGVNSHRLGGNHAEIFCPHGCSQYGHPRLRFAPA